MIWAFVITKNGTRIEFVFSHLDEAVNRTRFEKLFAKKDQIEEVLGSSLEWNFKENRKQHYIRIIFKNRGLEDEKNWPKMQVQLVDSFLKMEKAISPYIQNL